MPNLLAARSSLLAVTNAGARIVAVGLRGQVVLSDDNGKTWMQAKVPVSSDLVAVSFPSARKGWAVGHGGVVLHSEDGGLNWRKQLDGRQVAQLAVRYYQGRAASDPVAARILAEEKSLAEAGGTQPFLSVYFESDTTGYVVGTFNRIFRTDDGGKSWQPLMDHTENPKGLHFNAIGGGHGLYLAGEQGVVWRLDEASKRFVQVPTPYNGSLFGLMVDSSAVLAFGMRGSVYRSTDAGANWTRVAVNSMAGITGSAVLRDGAIVLVTQAGGIDLSRDEGKSFSAVKPSAPMPYYGVNVAVDGSIVLIGSEGVRIEAPR